MLNENITEYYNHATNRKVLSGSTSWIFKKASKYFEAFEAAFMEL